MTSRLPTIALALACFVVIVRCAWVGDDAYITLRTVDNFVHGHGLTWNTAERVQTYTHPLWMALLALVCSFGVDAYWAAVGLGLATSAAFLAVILRKEGACEPVLAVTAVALMTSKAFVDYSTSGLENPLTHLLLALFFMTAWSDPEQAPKLGRLSLLASLGVLNRMDAALLFAPALLAAAWRVGREKGWRELARPMALGGAPLVSWWIFSTWYYGSPVPNTAYAKLNTGIPLGESFTQGLVYLRDSLARDPITLPVLFLTLLAIAVRRTWALLPAALGAVLYLAYVVRVGGDFMSGRFLTAPFIVAVLAWRHWSLRSWKPAAIPAVLLIAAGLSSPGAPLRSDRHYGANEALREDYKDSGGVADERAVYYHHTGLLRRWRAAPPLRHPWAEAGRDWLRRLEAGEDVEHPIVCYTIGFLGFTAGPRAHLVDELALASPLLARLPVDLERPWRVGHYPRPFPEGFLESVRLAENRIAHPELAVYYGALTTVTRGDLWSWPRLKVLAAFVFGRYDPHLKAYLGDRPITLPGNSYFDLLGPFRAERTRCYVESHRRLSVLPDRLGVS